MRLNFDICDISEWKNYIDESISSIINSSSNLIAFNHLIKQKYSNISINDLLEDKILKNRLFIRDGKSKEKENDNPVEIYKKLFGWYIKGSETVDLKLAQNEELNSEIILAKKETPFTKFLRELKNRCQEISKSAYEKELIPAPYLMDYTNEEEMLKVHEKVIEEIKILYGALLQFTILYNEKTLFIWTLRKNTKKYLEFQYKALRNPKYFQKIKGLFDLEVFHRMNIEDPEYPDLMQKIKRAYTIFQLKNGGLGDKIVSLNNFIFDNFEVNNTQVYSLFSLILILRS